MADVAILVLNKIVDDGSDCSRLVVLYGDVNCVSVAVFALFDSSLIYLIFVKDGIFTLKQILEIVTK